MKAFALTLVFLFFVLLCVPNFSQAQIVADPTFTVEFPSLGVNSMTTDEYTAIPGEVKNISVQVENVSIHPADFKYKLKLIPVEGSFVASAANGNTLFNETDLSSTVKLKGGEVQDLDISYKIPDYVRDSSVLQFIA